MCHFYVPIKLGIGVVAFHSLLFCFGVIHAVSAGGDGEERINMLEPLEDVDEDGDKDKFSIDDVMGWVEDAL